MKLPMVYHVFPQTNGSLKLRTFFCVDTELLCPVQLPEGMGVSGLSAIPLSSHWFVVLKQITVTRFVSLV